MPSPLQAALDAQVEDQWELRIGGKSFRGWEECWYERCVRALAGAFELKAIGATEPLPILPGEKCEILIGGELVLTGYVDAVHASEGDGQHDITVSGRDRTSDLIDCSAISEPGEWINLSLTEVVQAILSSSGFEPAIIDVPLPEEAFDKVKLQRGETIHAIIDRLCKTRGFLAYADEKGRLTIGQPNLGPCEVALVQGENIEASALEWNMAERYSRYIVRGQHSGNDYGWGDTAAGVKGEATDSEVTRPRTLVVLAEGHVTPERCEQRAQWEATVRAAKSQVLQVMTPGTRQRPGGSLWKVNRTVPVRIASLLLDTSMLIDKLRMRRGEEGTSTLLDLVRPSAFDPQPDISKDKNLLGDWATSQDIDAGDAGELPEDEDTG